ncbi:MAG: NADH:ubiquinone oxidoreductase [Rhodospirillales bacterium]|nr:NADH:ubiquinone oxidoreductase [Rhodospirillales bacterium]MDK9720963.1 HupU protein [Rhodospirillales bacterium]
MSSLIWLQAGGCSGDTMALLCAEQPDITEFIKQTGLELLWHPSLSSKSPAAFQREIDEIAKGGRELTVLCVEGSIETGPNGTGYYDTIFGRPKSELIRALSLAAAYVVAVGTCASFGGVTAAYPNPTDATGLQFRQYNPGGLFDSGWRAKSGLPVVNISGCPAHPQTVVGVLGMLLKNRPLDLNQWNMPSEYYQTLVHQGCTRNEYHEYDAEETQFGHEGCLFFNLGCQGPLTLATCNSQLWNQRSSKTRAGVPCLGCTMPDFPRAAPLFSTEKVGEVPVILPLGVSRPNYMAYKGLAQAAAPERIANRRMKP